MFIKQIFELTFNFCKEKLVFILTFIYVFEAKEYVGKFTLFNVRWEQLIHFVTETNLI